MKAYKCPKCSHVWIPEIPHRFCPNCDFMGYPDKSFEVVEIIDCEKELLTKNEEK